MIYRIGDISKIIGETTYTLRYYAKEGLLPFAKRDENGIRYFEEKDLELFYVIKCLKSTGMPIKEIASFVELYMQGDKTITERRQMFEARLKVVEEKLKDTQELYDSLRYRCWFFKEAEKAGTVNIKYTLKEKDIPKDLRPLKAKFDLIHLYKPSKEPNK